MKKWKLHRGALPGGQQSSAGQRSAERAHTHGCWWHGARAAARNAPAGRRRGSRPLGGWVFRGNHPPTCGRTSITQDGSSSHLVAGSSQGYKDGPAISAQFFAPQNVAFDSIGTMIISDVGNNRIRALYPNGTVTTVFGSDARNMREGAVAVAMMDGPVSVAVSPLDGTIYVLCQNNGAVYRFDVATQMATILYNGMMNGGAIVVDNLGYLYFVDSAAGRLRVVPPFCANTLPSRLSGP